MKLSDLSNFKVVKAPTITPGYNNNPFNIKAGSETQQYISNGTASMGTAATDGGNFLKFNSRNDAIAAAQDLLFKSGVYKGLSVDSALKKWSNNAYGGNIAPDLATSTIDSLTPDQQTKLLNAMELKGENDAVPAGVKTLQNIGSYKVVTPNQKTNTPNRFLPQSPLDGTPIATMAANAKAGKNPIVDFVTGSEQQFGKAMAGAITGQSQVADAQKVTADEQNYIKTLVDERAKIQASGGDTSRLDGMIANAQKSTSATYQQPDIPTTASAVEGALGTAADIATMGTYGAASKGAKFGELMAKESEPLAVSAGKKVLDKTGKLIIGSDATKTLEQIANPEAKAFIPKELGGAGKTFEDVVKGTSDAIDSFVAKSKAALQAVKQAIPNNIYVDGVKIGNTVNDAIMKSVKSSADYKGIAGDAETLFKTPKDLVDSGLLDSNEASKVKGMVDAVKNWKDTSARGILNLKEQLGTFYKGGLDGSNKILSNIQNGLKDLVGEVAPDIKPALKVASDNIDKADEFTRNLVGKTETSGESKLISIAKNLKNPALKGYQTSLLEDLKTATGHDVMSELKGYADYLELHGKEFPSKAGTIIKAGGKRIVTAGLGAGAAVGADIGLGKVGLPHF